TGTELEVDLGPLSGLKNGESFSFAAPPGFGPGGADGGTFAALQTFAPFTGTFPRNVTFTTDASVDPRSFDNKGTYITKIAQAQGSIDAGNGSGWLPSLNALAPAGEGGIIINTATEISMLASNVASWTTRIGANVNNNLPFSTTTTLPTGPEVVPLWTGTRTGNTTTNTVEVGMLTVDGNPAADGSSVEITFHTVVPEPGTFSLVATGLSGLVWAGRRQRKQGRGAV